MSVTVNLSASSRADSCFEATAIYLGAINQRLEAARFECRFDPIREGHILARIGDENPGFRPNARRNFRDHSMRPQAAASRQGMLPNFGRT